MAKPEKRWQLLLVADDGRIVPFKRIKGIAVTLGVLMVLLVLACLGLGWQLTAEKVRHGNTRDRLADANRQLEDYKEEVELITTELVLAHVRMEKAGLPVTRRHQRIPQQASLNKDDATTATVAPGGDGETAETPAAGKEHLEGPKGSKPAAEPSAVAAQKAATESAAEQTVARKPSQVGVGDLAIKHNTKKRVLSARFRVKNNAPGSGKIAGQCVVVLQKESLAPRKWLALPQVSLENGIPDGKRGRAFKISRFIDMEIMVPVETDPSVFDVARVYVFDPSGAVIAQKDYPVSLPAPQPVSEAKPQASAGETPSPSAETEPQKPIVALGQLEMTFDAVAKVLLAKFKVSNSGSRSTPVAGRCVVVLKSGQDDPTTWLAMPQVKLVDGEPQGTRGQAFRIARFRNMEIKARGVKDPSVYTTAIVYVFDSSGVKLLEQSFPIDLPAPAPAPEPAPPAVPPVPAESQAAPVESGSLPASNQTPQTDQETAETVETMPPEPDPAAGNETPQQPVSPPTPAPSDDPSPTEGVEPQPIEDTRSRF